MKLTKSKLKQLIKEVMLDDKTSDKRTELEKFVGAIAEKNVLEYDDVMAKVNELIDQETPPKTPQFKNLASELSTLSGLGYNYIEGQLVPILRREWTQRHGVPKERHASEMKARIAAHKGKQT